MKCLGIDFGEKRVGIAISDDKGVLAFPYLTVFNDSGLPEKIKEIARKEKIEKVVLGESKNFAGMPNKIMKEIEKFKKILEEKTGLPIFLEPEFMTSVQAKRLQGKNEMQDSSAAAIILQSHLDRLK